MILRRITLTLAAVGALAASVGVVVVSLVYAIYAVFKPYLGAAGASAVVALILALGVGGGALGLYFITRRGKPVRAAAARPVQPSSLDRVLMLAREKPVVAISTAIGAGILAVRNPRYLGAAIRSFAEGRPRPD